MMPAAVGEGPPYQISGTSGHLGMPGWREGNNPGQEELIQALWFFLQFKTKIEIKLPKLKLILSFKVLFSTYVTQLQYCSKLKH